MKTTINKVLVLAVAMLALNVLTSQAQEYKKGDNLLNLGIGLGGGFGTPIGLSFEHGFTDKISAGAMVTYSSKTTPIGFGAGDFKYTYIIAGARASYHFDFGVKGLDPYAGAMLGYNVATATAPSGYGGTIAAAGGFIWGGHAGARYFFSEKIGAFAEVGYGAANLTIGAAFKF